MVDSPYDVYQKAIQGAWVDFRNNILKEGAKCEKDSYFRETQETPVKGQIFTSITQLGHFHKLFYLCRRVRRNGVNHE